MNGGKQWFSKLAIILGILMLQSCYLLGEYTKDKQEVIGLEKQIKEQSDRWEQWEKEIQVLEESKEDVRQKKLEVSSMGMNIPAYNSSARELREIMQILDRNGFSNVRIETVKVKEHIYYEMPIVERLYVVKYVAPFSWSKEFLTELISSYPNINIERFYINNAPQAKMQDREAYKLLYGESGVIELVETTLEFAVFSTLVEEEEVTKIEPIISNTKEAFWDIEEAIKKITDESPYVTPLEKKGIGMDLTLTVEGTIGEEILHIIPDEEGWGLKDQLITDDMNLYIEILKEGYEIVLEDAGEEIWRQKGKANNEHPIILVQSDEKSNERKATMGLSIYLSNDTTRVVTINIVDSLADRVHIYNEDGMRVLKGEVKGRVIVR